MYLEGSKTFLRERTSGTFMMSRGNGGEGRSFNQVIAGDAQLMDAPRPMVHLRYTGSMTATNHAHHNTVKEPTPKKDV